MCYYDLVNQMPSRHRKLTHPRVAWMTEECQADHTTDLEVHGNIFSIMKYKDGSFHLGLQIVFHSENFEKSGLV